MTKGTWQVILAVTVLIGIWIGFRLSAIPNLHSYKLLNITGILYSLLAVFVLSEVFIQSAGWKAFCVEKLAPVLLWSQTTIPAGVMFGAGLAWLFHRGTSVSVVAVFGFGLMAYMGIVGGILEQTVVLPRLFKKDIESRWRWFGLVLLTSGLLFQLVAAIQDLSN